jgi:FMN-dependent NADH-azoreductase
MMAKLLYIETSPRGKRSASSSVAGAFLDAYRKTNPKDTIETLNLWTVSLPSFDGDMLDAKYAVLHGQKHSDAQASGWKTVSDMATSFKSADKYLLSVPMWNFSIPYKVKHYFDIIIQPGLTFSFSPSEGYKGLVTGKKAAIVYSRGGAYGPGTGAEAYDLQTKTLSGLLGFIGIIEQHNILVEPTLAAPDAVAGTIEKASGEARRLATAF